jgi:hypothetical protein
MSTKVKIILGLVGAVVVAGILIDVTGGSSGSGVSKYYTEGYNAGSRPGRLRASCSADANALVLAQRLGCIADALVLGRLLPAFRRAASAVGTEPAPAEAA